MALGPKFLEKNLKEEAKNYEKIIDASLVKYSIVKGGTITVDVPMGMKSAHFALIKQAYLDAGWSEVELAFSQHDGEWLSFKY